MPRPRSPLECCFRSRACSACTEVPKKGNKFCTEHRAVLKAMTWGRAAEMEVDVGLLSMLDRHALRALARENRVRSTPNRSIKEDIAAFFAMLRGHNDCHLPQVLLVQRSWRGTMERRVRELQGEVGEPKDYTNETDIVTGAEAKEVPDQLVFVVTEPGNHRFFFDIRSLDRLLGKWGAKNPYTMNPLSDDVLARFKRRMAYLTKTGQASSGGGGHGAQGGLHAYAQTQAPRRQIALRAGLAERSTPVEVEAVVRAALLPYEAMGFEPRHEWLLALSMASAKQVYHQTISILDLMTLRNPRLRAAILPGPSGHPMARSSVQRLGSRAAALEACCDLIRCMATGSDDADACWTGASYSMMALAQVSPLARRQLPSWVAFMLTEQA